MVLKLNFCSDFEHKVGQDFEAGVCSAFCHCLFVEVKKLKLGRASEGRFGPDFEF